jgi:hypothetical protein
VALIDILAEVNTNLVAWYAAQAPAQTLYTGLSKSGLIAQDKAPPAVIWVPGSDSYEGAQGNFGTLKTDPRCLRQRILGVNAWLWAAVAPGVAEDFAQLDTLINATIAAVHHSLLGSYRVLGGTYQGLEDSEPGAFGRVYVLNLQFIVPVVALVFPAQPSTVVVAAEQTTKEMQFPASTATNP